MECPRHSIDLAGGKVDLLALSDARSASGRRLRLKQTELSLALPFCPIARWESLAGETG